MISVVNISSFEYNVPQLLQLLRNLAPPDTVRMIALPLAANAEHGNAVQVMFLDYETSRLWLDEKL